MGYYDEISSGYNELHAEEQKKKFNLVKKYIKGKVLDVGCGTGLSTPEGAVGIDPSPGLLKLNPNNEKILGRAECLPFEDKSFDTVISLTAIHNFDDIEKSLKEMKRVSKGRIIISLLKKSKDFDQIKKLIEKEIKPDKTIDEEKDLIFLKL
ncbi:class I SAM-dependent methyltransferase [Candidatus Woesearchaeota archaeon]|nr:class I SAM-dependent methyltransferase [Candidatus Woesearchaeota archaeon]